MLMNTKRGDGKATHTADVKRRLEGSMNRRHAGTRRRAYGQAKGIQATFSPTARIRSMRWVCTTTTNTRAKRHRSRIRILLSIGVAGLVLALGGVLITSRHVQVANSQPDPARIVFEFAGTTVTAEQLDQAYISRSEQLSHQNAFVGTADQLREISDYSLYAVLDKIEVERQLSLRGMSSLSSLTDAVAPPQPVSLNAAQQFFHEHPVLFTHQPPRIHVREIVVRDRATAQRVLDRLNHGIPFQDLAGQYSIDPQAYRDQGGDIGWVEPGKMPSAWDAAVFGLAPNETSGIIHSMTLYYVVQMIQGPQYDVIPFNDLTPSGIDVVTGYTRQQRFLSWLSAQIEREPIKISDPTIVSLVQTGLGDMRTYPDQGILGEDLARPAPTNSSPG